MKNSILAFLCFGISIFSLKAQALKELVIEKATSRPGVAAQSCNSPAMGVLVFNSAIDGLEFKLSMQNMLFSQVYNRQSNEYVLCVQPTERGIVVMINSREYEMATIRVESIIASTPQFFRINPKETGSITLPDNDPVFLRTLGANYLQQGDHANAITALQRSINIRPRDAEAHFMLGSAYYAQGRYTDAANSFKNAVDLDTGNAKYRNDLQKALAADPNKARTNFNMGNSYFEQNNYAEALKHYREAAQLDPQNNTYQTSLKTAEQRFNQEQHMNAAATAYRSRSYRQAVDEVSKAMQLGQITPYMKESLDFYDFEYQYYQQGGDVSCSWMNNFLRENPNSPFRAVIEGRVKNCRKAFRGVVLGVGMSHNNIFGMSGLLGLRFFNTHTFFNFYPGVQFGYISGNYFNTDGGNNKEPEGATAWDVTAMQISIPLTLQLNIIPIGYRQAKAPSSIFVAVTGQPNFNVRGKCWDESNNNFVNPFGYSGTLSVGYSTNIWAFSIFARQNFFDLFNSEEIYKFDNNNSLNDYERLEKRLENRIQFGASLVFNLENVRK